MTRITLALPDGRNQIAANDTATIKEILDNNNVNYATASVMLDGMVLSPENLRQTLSDLGATGDATIAVCVKMANA